MDDARKIKRDFVIAHIRRCVLVNGSVANGSTGLIHSSEWIATFVPDYIHPNKAGHAIMAPRIYEELKNLPKGPTPKPNDYGKYEYQIYSIIGQLLKTFISKTVINYPSDLLKNYPAGIYIITENGIAAKYLF